MSKLIKVCLYFYFRGIYWSGLKQSIFIRDIRAGTEVVRQSSEAQFGRRECGVLQNGLFSVLFYFFLAENKIKN